MQKITPLPEPIIELSSLRGGLIASRELEAAGVTRNRVSRLIAISALSRVAHGILFIPTGSQRCRERVGQHQHLRLQSAYKGVLGAGMSAAAAGQSALVIHGVQGLPAKIASEITTKTGCATARDGYYHNLREPYQEVMHINGVKVVAPALALAQAISALPKNNAVAVMDSLRFRKILTAEGLAEAKAMMAGRTGVNRVTPWWLLVNPRAESPAETFARLTCADLGCPPDAVQLEVYDAHGAFVARVDLGWRLPDSRWLLGEVDGFEFHASREHHRADLNRQNRLLAPNTVLRRWTGADAMNGWLATEVSRFLKAAGWRPGCVSARQIRLEREIV